MSSFCTLHPNCKIKYEKVLSNFHSTVELNNIEIKDKPINKFQQNKSPENLFILTRKGKHPSTMLTSKMSDAKVFRLAPGEAVAHAIRY